MATGIDPRCLCNDSSEVDKMFCLPFAQDHLLDCDDVNTLKGCLQVLIDCRCLPLVIWYGYRLLIIVHVYSHTHTV